MKGVRIRSSLTAKLLSKFAQDKTERVKFVKPVKWNGKKFVSITSKITPATQRLATQYSFRNILKRIAK